MARRANPSSRQVDAAQNQSLFRILNANLRELEEDGVVAAGSPSICECADTTCFESLPIDVAGYADLRTHPRRFAVAPDHVFLDVERVVARCEGYWLVEKSVAALARIDPHALPVEGFDAPQ